MLHQFILLACSDYQLEKKEGQDQGQGLNLFLENLKALNVNVLVKDEDLIPRALQGPSVAPIHHLDEEKEKGQIH